MLSHSWPMRHENRSARTACHVPAYLGTDPVCFQSVKSALPTCESPETRLLPRQPSQRSTIHFGCIACAQPCWCTPATSSQHIFICEPTLVSYHSTTKDSRCPHLGCSIETPQAAHYSTCFKLNFSLQPACSPYSTPNRIFGMRLNHEQCHAPCTPCTITQGHNSRPAILFPRQLLEAVTPGPSTRITQPSAVPHEDRPD